MSARITPLGGLGEIGLNCMVVEEGGRRIVVDCGVLPGGDWGAALAVPDLRALDDGQGIDAILVTHAHEDHVGAVAALVKKHRVPVYGAAYTLAVLRERLDEARLDVPLHAVKPGDVFEAGPFLCEPFTVAHSIPDAFGFGIETGAGLIVHTGDFKLDLSVPAEERLDLARLARWGHAGVALLLSDSTNAEKEGFSTTEASVGDALGRRLRQATGRVFVALFASHVRRMERIIREAAAAGRRVALAGRSAERHARLAQELGLLRPPPGVLIDLDMAARLPPRDVLVICTGAQGETGSTLDRLSRGTHAILRAEPGDWVILSARTIPGYEKDVIALGNRLARKGLEVLDRPSDGLHTTGHAQAGEQRLVLEATRPRHFVPVHGEYRMLQAHARTALGLGMAASDVFVIENGESIEIDSTRAHLGPTVPVGRIWLEDREGPVVADEVLLDRELASTLGVVAVWVGLDPATGILVQGPEVSGRGIAAFEPGSQRRAEVLRAVREALSELPPPRRLEPGAVEEALTRGVRRVWRRQTGTRPPVAAVVTWLRPPSRPDDGSSDDSGLIPSWAV